MTLGYSRRQYVEFTTRQDQETFLRCQLNAFHYFGGVPAEVLYDNVKTAVDHREAAGEVVWNRRFRDFADYYGFLPRACQPYRAQTKGKVETGGVKIVVSSLSSVVDSDRQKGPESSPKGYPLKGCAHDDPPSLCHVAVIMMLADISSSLPWRLNSP